jgi:protein-S-isoprenylcysteine O-methyltransferase Ste14
MAQLLVGTWGGVVAQRVRNFAASFLFVTVAFLSYRFAPHIAGLRDAGYPALGLEGVEVLTAAYAGFSLLLLLFYFTEKTPRKSKSIAALRAATALLTSPLRVWREGLPYEDRLGLLTMLLKGFFAPLMILSLFDFTDNLVSNADFLFTYPELLTTRFLEVFNSHGFWFLLQIIVFVDVLFFTVGYLVEHPRLKNEIRSVDPTLLGWGVAIACYPPFNGVVASILGWGGTEFPQFDHPGVHLTMNFLLLGLMAIYASASVALNLKASNLTHRGIISHGPYRYVRHPAYVCKNLAWWIGTVPATIAAWELSPWSALLVIGSTASWTGIYALRALTEEDHLRTVDGEYDAYCTKVPYRFIPRVY